MRDDDDFAVFVGLMTVLLRDYSLEIYHYALMPNHYHLVVHAPEPGELSLFMKRLGYRYTIAHKVKYGGYGRLWQNRFRSRTIRNDADLLTVGLYVDLNPVRAGLCRLAREWQWSSARPNLSGRLPGFLTPNPAYLALGSSGQGRAEAYCAMVDGFSAPNRSS